MIPAYLGWGVLAGVVFSAIGAAGGILTSFGLITLFAVADPNSVKPMTQLVVLAATLTFVPGYFRRSAVVLPLGVLLGAGGLVGAYVGSTLSSLLLSDMTTFRPLFGVLTLAIAVQIVTKLVKGWFSREIRRLPGGLPVRGTSISLWALSFSYGDHAYRIPLRSPLLAGAGIAMLAAIFGVGGGFLLVPYLSVMLGLPMYIIPATAAIAIFMSLAVSISNFVALGAEIQFGILIPLIVGVIGGAILGPKVNRAMPNAVLQAIMAVIVTGIGVKYLVF